MDEQVPLPSNKHPSGHDDTTLARVSRRLNGETLDGDESVYDKWKQAKDYGSLLGLNKAFLRGELDFALYHEGPIFVETKPLPASLLRLHDYGMLTVESQPWAIKRVLECDSCEFGYACANSKEYVVQQTPFLTFLFPENDSRISSSAIESFAAHLLANMAFYASIIKFEDGFPKDCDETPQRNAHQLPRRLGDAYQNARE